METNCSGRCPLYNQCSSAARIYAPDAEKSRLLEEWTLPDMNFLNTKETFDYEEERQLVREKFADQPEMLATALAGIKFVEVTSHIATEVSIQAHETTRELINAALEERKQRYAMATKFMGLVAQNGCNGPEVRRKRFFRKGQSCSALVDDQLKKQVQQNIDKQEATIRQGLKDGTIIRRR